MPTFIEKCRCKGSRPAGIVGLHHTLRPDITGTLLRDRRVVRFLIAPTGYGKSSCAYEYAQVVFGFENVFWVRCDSPCFIRDLDDGTLVDQIRVADPDARLVVLDDVPHLDSERTDAFDGALGAMLGCGLEVLVCCIPSVDTFSSRQLDKIVVDGHGLLLTDDEIEVERLRGNVTESAAEEVARAGRAACLIWGERGVEAILKGIADEELPSELELLMFCMLSIGEGAVFELRALVGDARIAEDAAYLASMYPYLGIDADVGAFRCIDAAVGDVLSHSRFSPTALARSSVQDERAAFCFACADVLLGKGRGRRAAELVGAFAPKRQACAWVRAHGWDLMAAGLALPVVRLTEGAASEDGASASALWAQRSWACAMLGDVEGAAKARRRVLRGAADWRDVAAAALSEPVAGKGPAAAADLDVAAHLREAMQPGDGGGDGDGGEGAVGGGDGGLGHAALLDWDALLRLERERATALDEYPATFADEARRVRMPGQGAPARKRSLLLSGAWFLAQCVRTPKQAGGAEAIAPAGIAASVVEFLAGALSDRPAHQALTWPECVAADAVRSAQERWPCAFDVGAAPAVVAAAREMSVSLLVQSEDLRRGAQAREAAEGEYQLTHESPFRGNAKPASQIAGLRVGTPTLLLSLFGGFEAWIGSDRAEPRQIRRRNAKIALALLAMNRGREVTKDRMAHVIWPDADAAAGRQNLYVVWAYLKKMLKVGPSCPYLVSTQTGYKLDGRYVSTDVEEFEDLCRGLLFGREDKDVWEELYEKVGTGFAEDLLPEVSGNQYVDAMRKRFRTQLVDGLVEASARMAREGEMRGALWFSREALRRDRSREDAYIALMEAQIASNQRGAALDTYFECRRFLSEQLGIDPSKRVVELYRSVIETEEEF